MKGKFIGESSPVFTEKVLKKFQSRLTDWQCTLEEFAYPGLLPPAGLQCHPPDTSLHGTPVHIACALCQTFHLIAIAVIKSI